MILSQGLTARGQVPKQAQIRIVKLDERASLHVKRKFLDVANLHEDTQSLLKIAGSV